MHQLKRLFRNDKVIVLTELSGKDVRWRLPSSIPLCIGQGLQRRIAFVLDPVSFALEGIIIVKPRRFVDISTRLFVLSISDSHQVKRDTPRDSRGDLVCNRLQTRRSCRVEAKPARSATCSISSCVCASRSRASAARRRFL
jgi:hypothetical protein